MTERLGEPLETVKSRLKRAPARLRKLLDEVYDGYRRFGLEGLAPLLAPRPLGWSSTGATGAAAVVSLTLGGVLMKKLLLAGSGLLLLVIAALLGVTFAGRPDPLDPAGSDPSPPLPLAGLPGADRTARPETPGPPDSARPARREVNPVWRMVGRVMDPEGAGIPSAQVAVEVDRGTVVESLSNGRSLADGRYEIDISDLRKISREEHHGLALRGTAWAEGSMASEARVMPVLYLDEGLDSTWTMDFVLHKGGNVVGRVVDRDGRPVGGAGLSLHRLERTDEDERSSRIARSSRSGLYRIGFPEKGAYALFAWEQRIGCASMGPLHLDPRTDHRLPDLVLSGKGAIRGTVVYADGAPVAGLGMTLSCFDQVSLMEMGRRPGEDALFSFHGRLEGNVETKVITDPQGRFEALGLQPGRWVLYVGGVHAPDLRSVFRHSLHTDDPEARVVIPYHRLRVEVTDGEGRPFPRASPRFWGYAGEEAMKLTALMRPDAPPAEGWRDLETSASGFLPLSRPAATGEILVEPGTGWVLEAEHPGRIRSVWACFIPPGRNETRCRLVLREGEPPASLAFALTGPGGKPTFERFHYHLGPKRQRLETLRDANFIRHEGGRSRPHYPGTYWLTLLADPLSSPLPPPFLVHQEMVELLPGTTTTVVREIPLGGWVCPWIRIAGRKDAIRLPSPRIAVALHDSGLVRPLGDLFFHQGNDGSFHLSRTIPSQTRGLIGKPLPAGWHRIQILVEGHAPWEQVVAVEAGKVIDLEVVLDPM